MRFARCVAAVALVWLMVVAGAGAEQAGGGDRALQAGLLSAGGTFACAVTAGGDAICWGSDFRGQLGNGPALTADQPSPTQVQLPPGRKAVAISASPGAFGNHACAILDDGSAVCWGSDVNGELGDGPPLANQPAPVPVSLPPGRRAVAISAGTFDSCVVLDDGSATCWGDDTSGELGNGAALTGTQSSPSPVLLPAGRRATAISAGQFHTCALLDDASAVCWGYEFGGKLGDGIDSGAIQPTPTAVLIPAPFKVTAISAGSISSCAALDDRSIMCWGADRVGELGDGVQLVNTNPPDPKPTPVSVLLPPQRSVTAVAVGLAYACAALEDGSVVCWGTDLDGELGNGSMVTANRSNPQTVPLTLSIGSITPRVADLSVTMTPATATLALGQTGQFTVRVANAGPDPASAVTVVLRSAGLAIGTTTPSRGAVAAGTWNVGPMPRGDQVTLVVSARATTAGSASLTAEVASAGEPDPDSLPGNGRAGEDDQATAAVQVPAIATATGAPAAGGGTAGASGAGKITRRRAHGLTLRVTHRHGRLLVTGSLGLPRAAACRGVVVITARHGTKVLRKKRVRLALTKHRCGYSASVPATKSSVRVTARFVGSTQLLPTTSVARTA